MYAAVVSVGFEIQACVGRAFQLTFERTVVGQTWVSKALVSVMAYHDIDRTVETVVQKQQTWQLGNKGSINYRACKRVVSRELSKSSVQ